MIGRVKARVDFVRFLSHNPQKGHRPLSAAQQERTLVILKPDSVQRGLVGEIITRFERRGMKLIAMKMVLPSRSQAEAHYAPHAEYSFFPRACRFLCAGPVVPMVWEGLNVISTVRRMVGPTDPHSAPPGTIRGDLGGHFRRNLVHAADSVESVRRECDVWFAPEEVLAWDHSGANWIYELPNAPIGFGEGEGQHPGHLAGQPGTVIPDLPYKGSS